MNRRSFLAGASAGLMLKLMGADRLRADDIPPDVQKCIDKGLDWLAKTQKADGRWEGNQGQYATAMTGLAGMAMLMEGSTLREGKYAPNIRKAIQWCKDVTKQDGTIAGDGAGARGMGGNYSIHGHGFGLLFMASAYGEDQDERQRKELEEVLTRAVDFSFRAQSRNGGWFYSASKDSDEGSTTVTQMQALRACRNAGIKVPTEVITNGQKYLKEKCTGPNGGIYYSPQSRDERPALTAAAVICGFSAGDYDDKHVKQWLKFCQQRIGPLGGGRQGHDEYTHYYFAQALYSLGETRFAELFPGTAPEQCLTWGKYRKAMFDQLVKSQAGDGSWTAGSSQWIGPVYVTSIYLTILQLDKGTLPIYMR